MQIEHGSFTPLVFSATGGMGRECEKFYNRLSSIIAEKRESQYNVTVSWIRRKISFALINAITTCIRWSRVSDARSLVPSITNEILVSEELVKL